MLLCLNGKGRPSMINSSTDLAALMKDISESAVLQMVRLLGDMTEKGILQRDPEKDSNILVYRKAGPNGSPEGWYSDNIFDVARELVKNDQNRYSLMNTLGEAGWMPVYSVDGTYQEIIRKPPDPPRPAP